jgi:dCMP deaminase
MDNDINELVENDSMCRVFLSHAYSYAVSYSKDPSTQLGAVLVKPHSGVIGWGVNGLPPRISNKEDRWVRPQKYDYIEHAERNVIYKCAERGICSTGLIMYCPWFACTDCARAIIQSGIHAVVGHKEIYKHTNDRWKESTETGISMLNEAGVRTKLWSGNIGNNTCILVNGQEFHP